MNTYYILSHTGLMKSADMAVPTSTL